MFDVFDFYVYKYDKLRPAEIESKLYGEITKALYKKYGENPDPLIMDRVQEEWKALRRSGLILETAFIDEFTSWMRWKRYPWLVPTGACLILYLLQITEANPLPAHVYCPSCHKITWYPEMPSGYDIDFYSNDLMYDYSDIVPWLNENCGCGCRSEDFICDGHNLLWQTVFGGADHTFVQFELHIPVEMESELAPFISGHWLNELADAAVYDPYKRILSENCLHLVFRYSLYKEEYPKTFMEWEGKKCFDCSALALHMALITNSMEMERYYEMHLLNPHTFGELLYNYGLFHGKGTWNDRAKHMVRKLQYFTPSLIVFKEDVFFYLRRHGYTPEDAWYGLQQAQYGLRLTDIKEELWWAHDKWILDVLADEKEPGTFYLCSKGYAAETLLHRIKKYACCNKTTPISEREETEHGTIS